MNDRFLVGGASACFVLSFFIGCGSGPSEEEQEQNASAVNNLYAVAEAYLECVDKTKKPPKSADDLKKFLDKGVDATAVYSSARDNEPYVIAWGVDPTKHSGTKPLVIAYEKTGINGKRMVLSNFGVLEMNEDEFQSAVFPPAIQP